MLTVLIPYFIFTFNPGALLLPPSCGRYSLGPPVWCQLWPQSEFPISSIWGHHLLYTIIPSPDIHPPLICCIPGVLGVLRIHSEGRSLVMRGGQYCFAPHYEVWLRALHAWNNNIKDIFRTGLILLCKKLISFILRLFIYSKLNKCI